MKREGNWTSYLTQASNHSGSAVSFSSYLSILKPCLKKEAELSQRVAFPGRSQESAEVFAWRKNNSGLLAALEATEMWSWLWRLNCRACPKRWNDEHSHRVSVLTEHEQSVWTWLWLRESFHPALGGWTYQSPQGVQRVLRLLVYKLMTHHTKCLTGHVTHFSQLTSKRYIVLKWLAYKWPACYQSPRVFFHLTASQESDLERSFLLIQVCICSHEVEVWTQY